MNRSVWWQRRQVMAAALLAGSLLAGSHLQAAEERLPKAETVMDKYIEVTGGMAAYQKLHNDVSAGTIELVGQGIKGSVTIYKTEPNKSLTVIELEGLGQLEEGADGQVAWSNSAVQGPRVKTGDEKAFALLAATFNSELRWRDLYTKAEVVGVESVDDQPCYKVVMTPKTGNPQTRYYHKKTNLLVKATMVVKTPMGEIPAETVFSDYRDENGILSPHKIRQKIVGQEFAITVDRVQYNTDIPKDRFALPDAVKALIAKMNGK